MLTMPGDQGDSPGIADVSKGRDGRVQRDRIAFLFRAAGHNCPGLFRKTMGRVICRFA